MNANVGQLAAAKGPPIARDLARPFERRRVVQALRSQIKLLLAVGLLGLFGGALVARFAVTLDYAARSVVQVDAQGAVAAMSWVESDRVLETARMLAREGEPVTVLRKRIEMTPMSTRRLGVTAHATSSEQAMALSDAVSAAFVAELLKHTAQERAKAEADRKVDLATAQAELERADGDLSRASNVEGVSDLDLTLSQARTRLSELESAIGAARVRATAAEAHGEILRDVSLSKGTKSSTQALVEAQRALSTLLAQHDAQHPDVRALTDRIRRLQSRMVAPGAVAMGNRAEARAETARANQLEREAALQRDIIVRLSAIAQRLSPLLSARDLARERVAKIERAPGTGVRDLGAAEVHARASVASVSNRSARALAALLAPLLALLLAIGMIVANEVRDFRICATTELAHWLQAPVVARSEWPGHPDRLEALIDELAESALDAPGTTLVLPLTDLERPLALSVASQLNGRAQRHFRTMTGARVTIAQAWAGDCAGPGVKRAAEIADRVLWVVSADTYTGPEIARRREAILRKRGVAAVLLDAEAYGVAARIGDASTFWTARSESDEAARSVAPPRVPLH